MESITSLLQNPVFWFSSVIMALFMGVLSSYVRDWIDQGTINVSKYWKQKKKANSAQFDQKVEELKNNDDLFFVYLADLNFQKTRNTLYYNVTYISFFFAVHNFANDNLAMSVTFAITSFLIFAFPCQIISLKIRKMRKVVDKTLNSNTKHFRD